MTTITDAFELPRPEDIRAMGFVIKLREAAPDSDEVRQLVADYVLTPAVQRALPHILDDMKQVFDRGEEYGRFIHGSFGSGKSLLVAEALQADAVPNHPAHRYKPSGLVKRAAWERTWEAQRREDAGEAVTPPVPPTYGSGDFARPEYWRLRGKLDVTKERFIAFTEVPGREGDGALYGWAGWTPLERLRVLLGLDEELEDVGVPLADRVGLLDSAWRLLPDVARDDPAVAARLKAELQAVVGADGPSPEMLADWRERFPPPSARARSKREKT